MPPRRTSRAVLPERLRCPGTPARTMRLALPHRLRRPAAALAAALALLAAGVTGAVAAPTPASLSRALAGDGLSRALTGAVAIDLATGEVVFDQNADLPLEPASTEKLTVSLAALEQLGPTFRTETLVLGEGTLDGDTWRGDVFLKGRAIPTSAGTTSAAWRARCEGSASGGSPARSSATSPTSTGRGRRPAGSRPST
ncbi:MAG: D-alanyl-D-alanine carboxypeptidase [Thermoleophilia bacterium]